MTVRILPFGDRALLAEVADLGAMLSLHGRLAASPIHARAAASERTA